MNNYIKYTFSFILVTAGILILIFYSDRRQSFPISIIKEDLENSEINSDSINISIDIQELNERIIALTKAKLGQERILPFMLITSKTCPPCSDNIVEYSELLNDHDLFFEPTLVFVDEESVNVDRFLYVNDLQVPHVMLDSEYAESLYAFAEKIIFIDLNKEDVFYTMEIPTVTVSISYKELKLNEVAMIWQEIFNQDESISTFEVDH